MASIPKTGTLYLSTISNVIGAGVLDNGQLCRHANVNKWSKYKPTDNQNPFYANDATQSYIEPITGQQRTYYTWQGRPKLTGGTSGRSIYTQCGFSIPIIRDSASYLPGQVKAVLDAQTENWRYSEGRPQGGATSAYRMDDFRGYNHDALPFMEQYPSLATTYTININQTPIFQLSVYFGNDIHNFDLQPSDFPLFNGLYMAMAIYTSSGTLRGVYYSDNIVTESVGGVSFSSISLTGWTTGTHYAYFYLTDKTSIALPLFQEPGYFSAKGTLNIINQSIIQAEYLQATYGIGQQLVNINQVNQEGGVYPAYLIKTTGTLVLQASLRNNTNSAITIPASDFTMQNMELSNGYANIIYLHTANSATTVSSVTIPAMGTVTRFFECPSIFWNGNANEFPPASQPSILNIALRYKGALMYSDTLNFWYDGTNGYQSW